MHCTHTDKLAGMVLAALLALTPVYGYAADSAAADTKIAGTGQTEISHSQPWTYEDEETTKSKPTGKIATPDTPIVSSTPHPAPGRTRTRTSTARPSARRTTGISGTTGTAGTAPAVTQSGWVRGKALKQGDTIGIVAPAMPCQGSQDAYVKVLQSMGYKVRFGPHARTQYGYLAGTDEERAQDVNDFFADDTVQAILCARGGYGSARLLDLLDYDTIRQHPKLLIGYSDITALQTALGEKARLVTASGMMLNHLTADNNYSMQQLKAGLAANQPLGAFKMPAGQKLTTIVPGTVTGRLAGGNLSVLTSLVGTPYALDGTGCILVLEETGEEAYRVDRMLNQLYQSGLLNRVAAICYGEFVDCGNDPGDFTVDDVLLHYGILSGKPVIKGLPIGHNSVNGFLPYGVQATVTAPESGAASLVINEAHAL